MRFWEGKWEKMSHSQRFITSNLKLVFRSSDLFISFFVQFHSSLWKFPRHNSLLCLIQSLLHSITILCFSSGVLLSRLGMTLSNIYYFHFLIEVPSFISFPLYHTFLHFSIYKMMFLENLLNLYKLILYCLNCDIINLVCFARVKKSRS